MKEDAEGHTWTKGLSVEDMAFLRRFLLASGSLKKLAEVYGISYPTVRLRLDRLIEKVRLLDEGHDLGPFRTQLRILRLEGKIDGPAYEALLAAYRQERGTRDEDA